jgi:hypothetical protein
MWMFHDTAWITCCCCSCVCVCQRAHGFCLGSNHHVSAWADTMHENRQISVVRAGAHPGSLRQDLSGAYSVLCFCMFSGKVSGGRGLWARGGGVSGVFEKTCDASKAFFILATIGGEWRLHGNVRRTAPEATSFELVRQS